MVRGRLTSKCDVFCVQSFLLLELCGLRWQECKRTVS